VLKRRFTNRITTKIKIRIPTGRQDNQVAQRYTQRQVRRQQRELRHQRREIQRSARSKRQNKKLAVSYTAGLKALHYILEQWF
jgi:ribosomal protein L14E/L6E/L27E